MKYIDEQYSNICFNDIADTMAKSGRFEHRIDNHLNHNELADIQQFTKKHMIHWSLTTKWLNFNAHKEPTSNKHTKDVSWKIKTSTNTLPTLDILNRNYPNLIRNRTNCLLCNSQTETNQHIWQCPNLIPDIRSTFLLLLEDLPPSEDAILLIRSYVTQDLYHIFKVHFNTQKEANRALMAFLQLSLQLIKLNVWKKRSVIWKQWKLSQGTI
ncbi:hypothetical protein RhiirA5_423012 [Rhizophagus irregularis]|uniref:Reverse transcriptase zinc-binding domain-containing protein n=1 Tax=Rhizophagus irregularis TaxID=588596 RepID=A0A2N0PAS6_9GLOM|nr:hypothetical protein RhiirA5_423012 [Rhizophagus irregularis]